jgi:hypothetical protein
MPTNQPTYNSRVTDEALEKKFRDTFKSQSGAELIDDLYASGVIVPVVDFTAAAEGSALRSDLQTAADYATTLYTANGGVTQIANSPGFYKVDLTWYGFTEGNTTLIQCRINGSLGAKPIWGAQSPITTTNEVAASGEDQIIIFLRTGETADIYTSRASHFIVASIRQIADVYGNLTNPLGYVTS